MVKLPEWFISLAKEMPNYKFAMVGGVTFGDRDYFLQVRQKAKSIDNLSFLGSMPFEEVNKLFGNVKVLVCTSEFCRHGQMVFLLFHQLILIIFCLLAF